MDSPSLLPTAETPSYFTLLMGYRLPQMRKTYSMQSLRRTVENLNGKAEGIVSGQSWATGSAYLQSLWFCVAIIITIITISTGLATSRLYCCL